MLLVDSPFDPLPAPGPHPATEELRAYAAGTLAPAEQHRLEAHALDCERCADLVDGFLMTDATTTDQAVAALRTRLQIRLGEPGPVPATPPSTWPRVAAAAALLGVVAGGLWTWEHRAATTLTATARLETAPPARPVSSKPQPAAAPAVAVLPAPTVATNTQASESGVADYVVMRPTRLPHAAASPRARRAADKSVGRIAVLGQAAAVMQPIPPAALAAPDTAKKSSAATEPAGYAAAAPAVQTSDTLLADKALGADSAVLAGRFTKAKAADNATIRVANTPMPAPLAINPAPVGGSATLRDYVRRAAAKFKPETNAKAISGTVRIKFIVEADGKLRNLKVVRGMRADYDSEALRIVCDGPAWQPGVSGGRRAPLPIEITVSF